MYFKFKECKFNSESTFSSFSGIDDAFLPLLFFSTMYHECFQRLDLIALKY